MEYIIKVQNWKRLPFDKVNEIVREFIAQLPACPYENEKYSFNDYNNSGVECNIMIKY